MKKPSMGLGKKKMKKATSAGPKMPPYLGVTSKKSEPDNAIALPPSMPLGKSSPANPGAKARAKSARVKRLTGVRL